MVNPALVDQATRLSADDRLELIGALWDSLDHEAITVSAGERQMLDERMSDLTPEAGRPAEHVLADLRRRIP